MEIMRTNPFTNWDRVAQQMGDRTARQVRERWVNYLSPTIRSDPWTDSEDQLLLDKINELGRAWSSIGHFFNGRSENDVKNRWYSHLRYRTITDSYEKLMLVTDPAQCPFPDRKKRNRAKISPKQNALRMMEQRAMQAGQPAMVASITEEQAVPPPQVEPAKAPVQNGQVADLVPGLIVDSWDHLLEDLTLEKYAIGIQDDIDF